MDKDKIKPLFGLLGVLIAALSAEFNDQVTSIALPDVLGGFAISHDPGTWVDSLYVTGEVIGLPLSPWLFATFTARRFALFVIAMNCIVTLLIPLSPDEAALFVLRFLQGLLGGMTIPMLLAAALGGLPLAIRLYGLAAYALTATFTPHFAATLAALWTEAVGWRFVFLEVLPFASVAGLFVWWGFPVSEPQYGRIRMFDWRGALGIVVGFGAFTTMLQQEGDRLDWFNSTEITVLALTSAIALPLFFVNEWFHPLPFLKLQLLGRRNLAYGVVGLFAFLIIGSSSSLVPENYLVQVQGFRPIQIHQITLGVALSQLILLPATSFLLDFEWVDARVVSFIGLLLILIACIGNSFVTLSWEGGEFYLWQAFQAVGQPMVVVPLLMLATSAVFNPHEEGPFASALVNTMRGLAEAVGAWLINLIQRWRGALHSDRLVDQAGHDWFRLSQASGALPGGGVSAVAQRATTRARQPDGVRARREAAGDDPDRKRHLPGSRRDRRGPDGCPLGPAATDRPAASPAAPRVKEAKMPEGSPGSSGGDHAAGGEHKDEKAKGSEPKPQLLKRRARWPFLVVGLILVAFVAVVLVVVYRPHADVWTDDATVTVHYATVAPRVGGQIATVQANDNQLVKAGQVLATIDPRDLQAAVDIAEGMLAQDHAQFDNASANIDRQPPLINQQQAAVASAEARLRFAQVDSKRFINLAAAGAGTSQQRQQADSQLRQEMAAVESARFALQAQQRQVAVLQTQRSTAEAAIKTDEARLAQAKLNLSYATIVAPVDGVVGNRSVEVGNYVAPGTALMTVVPLDQVYIEANYREVALRHVLPGQHASIHVDAYNIDLDGIVQSVPPASGAAFAPIAPSNATGNFTKVVQRLSVKIVVTEGQPLAKLLRVGFSVETTIHTGLVDVVGQQQTSSTPVLGN